MTVYLVRVKTNDSYYCAGVYTTRNAAKKRAEIFGNDAIIINLETDAAYRVTDVQADTEYDNKFNIWLGDKQSDK